MNLIPKLKRKVIKRIFGLFSFTTALFVFQACYGSPQPPDHLVFIEGIVKSKNTNIPIQGIEVSQHNDVIGKTDSAGKFYTAAGDYDYTFANDPVPFSFKDIDSTVNGSYAFKDTILIPQFDRDTFYFEVLLSEM